ncbi:unnamed protein product [Closterium sp. Yama58-4]|nr:unnamed protein product [Closterium sp. Yama58-4]
MGRVVMFAVAAVVVVVVSLCSSYPVAASSPDGGPITGGGGWLPSARSADGGSITRGGGGRPVMAGGDGGPKKAGGGGGRPTGGWPYGMGPPSFRQKNALRVARSAVEMYNSKMNKKLRFVTVISFQVAPARQAVLGRKWKMVLLAENLGSPVQYEVEINERPWGVIKVLSFKEVKFSARSNSVA